jgi:hypothetical protein
VEEERGQEEIQRLTAYTPDKFRETFREISKFLKYSTRYYHLTGTQL